MPNTFPLDDPGQPLAGLEIAQAAQDVVELFRASASRHAAQAAVSWRGSETSYEQLDRQSNQLAQALIANQAAPGTVVAVLLGDPLEQIAATLGCMKAGCIFASLDLSYPTDRLRLMLETIAPQWMIVDADSLGSPILADGAGAGIPLLVMGEARPALVQSGARVELVAAHGCQNIRVDTHPDDPCYIYFTSGSTGRPKAILGRIRGLAHFVQWEIATFDIGPGTRVSQFTGPAFDVYLRDILVPLCAGGTVCIPPARSVRDPVALCAWIDRERIALIHCVPSLFRLLLQQPLDSGRFVDLRFVLLAGESLPPADANRWIACFEGRARLVNLYGPTETTLAKFWFLLPAEAIGGASVPIGKPMSGAQALLLDANMAPCPPGELGEIFIRTPYRSLGYFNNAEANDKAFIRNPFTDADGDLLYRTGDLARQLPDGNFLFCGRKDSQVKVRGIRIELAEIESCLLQHPGVREAVVVARENVPGDIRLLAYYVPEASPIAVPELRAFLSRALPDVMVPSSYLSLPSLPLSANGKLDRGALPAAGNNRPELSVAFESPAGADELLLCETFAAVLGLDRVGRNDNFFELGGNSLLAVHLLARLREQHGTEIPATSIFSHPSPSGLARAIAHTCGETLQSSRLPAAQRMAEAASAAPNQNDPRHEPIAIIAMAGRFPGAVDVEQFWENLCEGRESITVFADDGLDPSIAAGDRLAPGYISARGVMEGVENFDAGFFGINPREAELMDPQHRIFLELCWECMERAGQVPDAASEPVGVFAGTYHSTYLKRHVAAHPELVEQVGNYQVTLANEKDYIATRIAHKLNLTGPAISLYTACSTSLVAVCQAFDSLRAGRCDMALAGGVSIICPPRSGYVYQEGAMFSPDGHTRTFDARAQGTVFSDGAAVVLLKRLSDAIRDGNPVYAVIRGVAVNNDGADKASFTAPSSDAQAAVIAMAQSDAGVSARSISYVEAHGTATPMGDPIEIQGLAKAFRRHTPDVGFCRIGSVKSNFGHLVIAAGAAGLIKTTLALSQRTIPASLHFDVGNPQIDFAGSPFVVNSASSAWLAEGAPLRAGVSSFGVGGTNAHVVVEQAPALPVSDAAQGPQLLVLSARSPAALAEAAANLSDYLRADLTRSAAADAAAAVNLADVAWTLATGRKQFAHRVAVVGSGTEEIIQRLRSPELAAAISHGKPAQRCSPVFLFPGQGSQYAGMGKALYKNEPQYRAAFDECADLLRDDSGLDLHRLVFSDDPAALLPTAAMQPALFAVEYSLARLWMHRDVMPSAMVGHSIGEFVAAALAGIFSLADALRLVARRGALMQAQPGGSMLVVKLPAAELLARLPGGLSLAAENAPGNCVVSGARESIACLQDQLESEQVACRLLHTSHAFHSQMMEPVVAPFRELVAQVPRSAPTIPIVSACTGDWLDPDTALSPAYWARHLRDPVRFAAALARVVATPGQVLLEVGPRATLSMLARQNPATQTGKAAVIPSLGDNAADELLNLRQASGQLWCLGVPVQLASFDDRSCKQRLLLPTYPFQRQRFWVEAAPAVSEISTPSMASIASIRPTPLEADGTALMAVPAELASAVPEPCGTVLGQVVELVKGVTGLELTEADHCRSFFELGLDSLMLTQVAVRVKKRFHAEITFRQLMREYGNLIELAAMLAGQPSVLEDAPDSEGIDPAERVSARDGAPRRIA